LNYYIFPAVIVSHFVFNLFCIWRFSSALIHKYKSPTSTFMEQRLVILKSVRFARKASIAGNAIQTLGLCAFLVSYNVSIMYYVPILWSVDCILWNVTFIRNRYFMQHQCRRWLCRCAEHNESALRAAIMARGDIPEHPLTIKRRATSPCTNFITHDEPDGAGDGITERISIPAPIQIERAATLPVNFDIDDIPDAEITSDKAKEEVIIRSPRTSHQLKLLHGLGVTTPNSPNSPLYLERLRQLSDIAEMPMPSKPALAEQLATHSDVTGSHYNGHLRLHAPDHEGAHSCGSPFGFDRKHDGDLSPVSLVSPATPSVSGLVMQFGSFSSPDLKTECTQKTSMKGTVSKQQPRSPSCPSVIRICKDDEVDMNYSGFVDLEYSRDGDEFDIV